ncbi:MAG: GNAT family N-acetyltransferase [Solirubrobacteraceae bacterium]
MPEVRELGAGESQLAAPALLELRPHLRTVDALTARADALRAGGYRLVASFEPGETDAAAAGGFRVADNLALGRHLYVDDLVTRAARRGRGHADAVMAWIEAEARAEDCAVLHLDSGVQAERADAHRFYFRHGMRIASYHFSRTLD